MRDSSYGLVFSLAVDVFQDEVGFDETYRRTTGCTIYVNPGAKWSTSTGTDGISQSGYPRSHWPHG
ncbi:hypothetical protein [Mameliella sp.]